MKKQLLVLTLVIMLVGMGISPAIAQTSKGDTLVISSADVQETYLNEIIASDTTSDGARKHAVYELEPNGWYPISTTIVAGTYDLNIVGGKREEGERRPIILTTTEFGGWQMFTAAQDLTFKGIWIMQIDETPGGNVGQWYRAGVALGSEDQDVVFHDVIFDFNCAFSLFGTQDGLDLHVTNTLMRFSGEPNNIWWNGFGFDLSTATKLDTVVIQNSTFYQGHFFLVTTWETTENLFKFDHNTVVDYTHFPIHGVHYTNAEFTNNLFVNAFTDGEDSLARVGQDPDGLPYGILNVDTTYYSSDTTISGDDTTVTREWKPEMEAERRILVSNNNNFVDSDVKDYWDWAVNYENDAGDSLYWDFQVADPTFYDGFMNSRTRAMFEDDATWPELTLENTTSLDPAFTNYPDLSDQLIQHSKFFYGADDLEPATIFQDPDGEPLNPTDPMVYDLSYTNETLLTASTTGGPVGDLTWFLDNGYNSTDVSVANEGITSVDEPNYAKKASKFELSQNYPNPFNPTTTIKYRINNPGKVKLTVYNLLGEKVKTLVNENMSTAGTHKVVWNATDNAGNRVPSGVYFYKLEKKGTGTRMRKMLLIK